MKIVSYNIDGITTKLYDNDFISFLHSYDIVCLVETFLLSIDSLPHDLFSTYHKYIAPAHKLTGQGRCSGGVLVFIKKDIGLNLSEIKIEFDNIVAIKISDKVSFNKKCLLVFTYVPPIGSPYYKHKSPHEKNGINILEECLCHLQESHEDCSFLICGDLNCRTANVQPLSEDINTDKYMQNVYEPTHCNSNDTNLFRKSDDKEFNVFGRSLLDLCSVFDLFIVNGALMSNLSGSFTNISVHGNSVVDYFLVSHDIMSIVQSMNVLSRTESWHMPIVLDLTMTMISQENMSFQNDIEKHASMNEVTTEKFVWDESKANIFNDVIRNEQSQEILNECTKDIYADVEKSLYNFNNILTNASASMKHNMRRGLNTLHVKSNWFDKECLNHKKCVRRLLNRYTRCKSDFSKQEYIKTRKNYKQLLKQKRHLYSKQKVQLLTNQTNQTNFWREINKICKKQATKNNIHPLGWYNYFRNAFQKPIQTPPICHESRQNPSLYDVYNELIKNTDITSWEINEGLKRLKDAKATGSDSILNEMLKQSDTVILPYLTKLFQYLFTKGTFPNLWSTSIIVPIHKKGDPEICDNYRPISLTSLVSKLYTNILNNRFSLFLDYNDLIATEQAGYREGFSPTDHIFTLYAMVKKQFTKDRKLYAAFVDYKACFDSIHREALFTVLGRNGLDGKLFYAIKSIYSDVLACVKTNNGLTESFSCPLGLRQGCLCSPKLFSLFINELSKALNLEGKHGIQFSPGTRCIFHLLFADDALLVSDTVVGLQNQLNVLSKESDRLGLEVNMDKTNVVVFRKGGFLGKQEKWTYKNKEVEVVNSYKYLGVTFTTKLSFTASTSAFVSKAKKACYDILKSLKSIDCYDFRVFTTLFDAKVKPILLYASELWGVNEMIEIERVHLFALKRFLNVSQHCSNSIVYSESGRYPLFICSQMRSLKFWLRLQKLPECRISHLAYDMLVNLDTNSKDNWVSDIKRLLCSNGYGYVWLFRGVGCERSFLQSIKLRLIDCFTQGWHFKLMNSENTTFYSSFKSCIEIECHLTQRFMCKAFRDALLKFRFCVSPIDCHRYKFYPNILASKQCTICKEEKEDELHFLLVCKPYEDLRLNILPLKYLNRRNVNDMCILMSNVSDRYALGKFLYKAFELRAQAIRDTKSN